MEKNIRKKISYFIISSITVLLFFSFIEKADLQTLQNLNNKLNSAQYKNEKIEDEINYYNNQIINLENEVNSIENQLKIINLEMSLTKSSLNQSIWKASLVQENIDIIEGNILVIEENISIQEDLIMELLKVLYDEYKDGEGDLIHILLSSENINDIINRMEYLTLFEKEAHNMLKSLQANKNILEESLEELDQKQKVHEAVVMDLQNKERTLVSQEQGKAYLLEITEGKEDEYERLLALSKQERAQVENEINILTKEIQIEKEALEELKAKTSSQGFKWPIPPNKITAPFQDPGYAKRFGRQHNGIDVRSPAGTNIISPKDGIVVKIIPPISLNLSYLIIDHGDTQTVYLHLSESYVSVGQEVSQGEVVAKTGGIPGVNGTGIGLSTGAHLHFEIRENGVPKNPLNYLP